MPRYLKTSILALAIALTSQVNVLAQTSSQKEAVAEVERQLRVWEKEGRAEDIKLINSHKSALMKQVKSGNVDLQAIVDEHNYKHKDGKYYGQSMSDRSSKTPTINTSKPNPNVPVAKSAKVPNQNSPTASYSYLAKSWKGFPAQLTYTAKVSYVFPNGYTVSCAAWDPRVFDPTPESIGQADEDCAVTRGRPEGKKVNKFKRGETLDIQFGNISASGIPNASSLSGSTLRMTPDGRIAIGKFSAFLIKSSGNGAGGGKRKRALTGTYALDGHLITIITDSGEELVGFASWTSDKGSNQIDHIYINGEHFWDRDK